MGLTGLWEPLPSDKRKAQEDATEAEPMIVDPAQRHTPPFGSSDASPASAGALTCSAAVRLGACTGLPWRLGSLSRSKHPPDSGSRWIETAFMRIGHVPLRSPALAQFPVDMSVDKRDQHARGCRR